MQGAQWKIENYYLSNMKPRALSITALCIILFFTFSCNKVDTEPENNPSNNPPANQNTKKKALFAAKVPCKTSEFWGWDTVLQYLNAPFVFQNLSDTGNVSYSWAFGDGSTSNETNPSHVYTKPGRYPVTLITSFNNHPSDTFVSNVNVMLGIFEIKQS